MLPQQLHLQTASLCIRIIETNVCEMTLLARVSAQHGNYKRVSFPHGGLKFATNDFDFYACAPVVSDDRVCNIYLQHNIIRGEASCGMCRTQRLLTFN